MGLLMSLRIESAPALRDAGIVATAVLDRALAEALGVLPVEVQQELKRGIGRAMAAVLEETVERAVRAHP